jgi:hypothetical protein
VTAYLSALAVCAVSTVVGAALACRPGGWSWTAPAVGLGVVMLLTLVAVRLPGHGTTAAVAVTLASVLSVTRLARRRVDFGAVVGGLPVAVAVLAVCSLPFVANDRIGELGAWVSSDLAGHMAQAEALAKHGSGHITSSGYPNGPHAVVAALDGGLGVGASAGFTGLLLAVPILTALTALAALSGTRWYFRLPGAALAGIPYLAVSYFAQGAFKEPLLALFFLGFVLTLRDAYFSGRLEARLALALLVITGGGVAVFGVTGLAWFAGALVWVGLLELLGGRRPDLSRWQLRRWLPAVAVLVVVAIAAVVVAAGGDFFDTGPGRYITSNDPGGNFFGQLSPLEALGVWHQPDFRFAPSSPLLDPGILLACAVVIFGLAWCWRGREWVLLAGALSAISIYVVARPFTLAYFSGKALTVAAPMLTLIAVKALATVASTERLGRLTPALAAAALAAYLLVAGSSSALVLRGTHVRPADRGHDLAAFRPIVDGQPTIYLGRDNFAPWELRGAQLRGFQSYDTPLALGIVDRPLKYAGDAKPPAADFDSVDPFLLGGARYVVAPRTAYASVAPANFIPIKRTRWHVLWERRGPLPPREILAEGEAPGKVLNCRIRRGRLLARTAGVAYVRPEPVVGRAHDWRVGGAHLQSGQSRSQELRLGPGTWDLSLRYFSDEPLRLRAGSLDTSLPAYVGDSSTFASAGRVVSTGGALRVTVTAPPRSRIEILRTAILGTLAATRVDDRGGVVPLARACGRYVDWFRVGLNARD